MPLPVYAVPGIGSDHTMYDGMAAYLGGGRELIGWNLPGYGDAPALAGYGFSDLAKLLGGEMDRRGHDRAHLLGHSIGGMVAQEFAALHPTRAASLMLSATTAQFGSRDGSFQKQFLADRLAPLDAGMSMAELAATFMPDLVGGKIGRDELDKAIAGMANIPEPAYRAAMHCLVTFNRRAEAEALTCPVLLLAGELDGNAPLKTMQRMTEFMPGSEIHVFEGVGHMAPIEVPNAFAGAISAFLGKVE